MGQSSVTSTRTRLGAAALGFGGVVFGLIQLIERSVGQFNPRPTVSVLLATTIGLLGLTLERLRHRTAEARVLTGQLRVWPLRRIADTDPLALGVFPSRRPAAYVARDEDAELAAALRRGGLVVVVGPERAGKTRTAVEVARRAVGDRPVVVPVGGPALGALFGDVSFVPPADAVWWLDDLERFDGDLGGAELDAITDPHRTVLTTVRDAFWQSLLTASGDDGERGRRLLAAATVVPLPDSGVGRELSGGEAVAAMPVPAPPEAEIAGREPDRAMAAGLLATGAAIAALAVVVSSGGFSTNEPPPIDAQIETIRAQAAADHKPTVLALDVALHGVQGRSHVFVMRPESGGSDELRIYDEVGGRLVRRLEFQPHTQGQTGSAFIVTPEIQQKEGAIDYALAEPEVIDVDGDGERELIASYFLQSNLIRLRLPVIVAWDDRSRSYRLSSLLDRPPPSPAPRAHFIDYFDGTYRLADPEHRLRVQAGGASSFAILPGTGRDAALLATGTETSRRGLLAVSLYRLGVVRGRPVRSLLCGGKTRGPALIRAPIALGADYRAPLKTAAPRLAATLSGITAPDGKSCLAP